MVKLKTVSMWSAVATKLDDQMPPLLEPPPAVAGAEPFHCTRQSIETLAVVLAAITILGVIAGIFARLCGGKRFGGNGENDIEGWVERRCKSCIDGGIPAPPPIPSPVPLPPQPPPEESKPPAEAAAPAEEKK